MKDSHIGEFKKTKNHDDEMIAVSIEKPSILKQKKNS
jgi:hypothetical protein